MAKKNSIPPKRSTIPQKTETRPTKIKSEPSVAASVFEPEGWLKFALIVLGITAFVYLPSIFNQYVNWDDGPNIDENENLKYLTWDSFKNIFDLDKGNVIGNYNPLPIVTFGIEKLILGKFSPTLTHLVNLLLHLGTVFFVIRFLLHLGISRHGAAVGGLLFGIHPMRVESVAWATERKDVLFAFFFFVALMYYVRWVKTVEEKPRWGIYIMTIVLALLAHLSKVQAVTLVLSMFLVDFWFRRRMTPLWFMEKIPFGIMALLIGLANIYTLNQTGSTDDNLTNFTPLDRFFVGTYQYCTYLFKLLIPYPMAPLYPYDRELPMLAKVAPIGFIATLGFGTWCFIKGKYRAFVFSLAFFFFNVMFLLQWKPAGQGYLADRFTYVPYFGFFFLLAWWYDKISTEKPDLKNAMNYGLGALFLIYAIVSFRQIKIWENGEALWSHVIKFEGKGISLAWGNRAQYFRNKGDFEKAIKDYTQAIQISPERNDHYNSRGKAYFDMAMSGKFNKMQRELTEKAIADYTKGIAVENVKPKDRSELFSNRGAAFCSIGDMQKGLDDLNQAISIDASNKNAYTNRALTFVSMNRLQDAINDHTKFLEFEPLNHAILYERGMCRNGVGDFKNAVEDLNKSIQLNPNLNFSYLERGKAYARLGQKDLARKDLEQARRMGLKITPEDFQRLGL